MSTLKNIATKETLDKFYEKEDPWGVSSYAKSLRNKNIVGVLDGRHFNCIVDLACGEGTVTESFLDFGDKVYGVDISEKAIKRAQARKSKVKYITGDIKTLNLENIDSNIDLVVCMDSLLFLSTEEKKEFFRKICDLSHKAVYFLLSIRIVPLTYSNYWSDHDFTHWKEIGDIFHPLLKIEKLVPVELDFFSDRGWGGVHNF